MTLDRDTDAKAIEKRLARALGLTVKDAASCKSLHAGALVGDSGDPGGMSFIHHQKKSR
ncbi:hypothetical protein [Candidatus Sodalis sp. SoCistrobi]|uniref:hypothetical protein n=1 Tax=Candidatus Sodalis sp. SoCistrobi TaxID=1922216 RepID=UPI001576B1C3|nr:hypothetical protein [Candidatus Sodalis sp. SoCistrobi]